MRVLHIFNSLLPSGAETMLSNAKDVLGREGIETDVVATLPNIGPYAKAMRGCGFGVYHIPHTQRCMLDLPYMMYLYKFIRKNKYDVVQIHPEGWRLTNVLVARLAGVRSIVTTVHSIFNPTRLRFVQRVLRLRTAEFIGARFVAIGDSVLANEVRFGIHPVKIYNWIDSIRFARSGSNSLRQKYRKEFNVPINAKVVALVGNCSEIKNHSFMMRVLSRLPTEYIVLHVGSENEDLTHERRIADELGVLDRIRFVGSRGDVCTLLECADVYVMCSLKEGCSIACLEALSKGLPSVVADVVGLRDIACITSLCVKALLDEEDFSKKIIEQASLDERRLRDLRCATSEVLAQNFSLEKNVRKYIDVWKACW